MVTSEVGSGDRNSSAQTNCEAQLPRRRQGKGTNVPGDNEALLDQMIAFAY